MTRSASLARLGVALALTWVALALALPAFATPAVRPELSAAALADMTHLYRDGVLPGGAPLQAHRGNARATRGRDLACANCHGRSGMGQVEGRTVIPPITGWALLRPGTRAASDAERTHEHHAGLATPGDRPAYDDASLITAIREGRRPDGQALDLVMPRYEIDDDTARQLVAYLHQLSAARTPGAVNDTLNFATIVTPDADPVARDAMLGVLRAYFATKNDFTPHSMSTAGSPTGPAQASDFRIKQRWQLHEWRLQGDPASWSQQLARWERETPVFAVISGIAGRTWQPVHDFCERQGIPCLFPNVDLPPVRESDFYPIYFSRGVLLEADLLAAHLEGTQPRPKTVVQVYRGSDIGAQAAVALREALTAGAWNVTDKDLDAYPALRTQPDLGKVLEDVGDDAILLLWLRPEDVARLPTQWSRATPAYLSGIMAGLERAPLPPQWRTRTRMTYPYALPDERRVMLSYPLGWLRVQHLPVVDERVQVDTYLACSMLAENLISTHGTMLRDFVVERVQASVGSGLIQGNYRRLGLAPGQRFASKGGYLVQFAQPTGTALRVDGEWTTP